MSPGPKGKSPALAAFAANKHSARNRKNIAWNKSNQVSI
jgi:hypothetical protein